MEKSVILGIATGQRRVGGRWAASFISEYATFLSSQGRLSAARDLLALLPAPAVPVTDVTAEGVQPGEAAAAALRDRIHRSGQGKRERGDWSP